MKTLSLHTTLLLFLTVAAYGQDVRINQADNADPNKNNATTQSETNHAVSPNGIVAAFNDSGQIPTMGTLANFVGWRDSADGLSFADGGFFQVGPRCYGDPAVVVDGSGFFYLAGLEDNYTGVGVARSTGTMLPISFAAPTVLAAPSGGRTDKELMSIDRTGGTYNNRIYLTVTNLNTGRILEAHTTSLSPLTFTSWQNISSTGDSSGSMSAVAPNGDVYAVWERDGNTYEIVRSTNGGGAWSNPDSADPAAAKVIATVAASPTSFAALGPTIRARGFPQIAIDSTAIGSPTRGYIYVVWHSKTDAASSDDADVMFTRSRDNGVTWSAPRSISSGLAATIGRDTTTNTNWNPSITVSPVNGHIYVTFYDRREDTTAADGDPANTKARIYRALSTDAGQTFNVAPLGASLFVPIGGFVVGGNDYWSEYNWSTSNTNGIQFTWGDSSSLCAPPAGAPNPCSASGRPDQDSYYHTVANLSGLDLFIKPWGAVTGEGPTWQTDYIYCVDGMGSPVNAAKGVVNHLRARVRNLGNAAASGAVIHFKFSPAYAGFNESVMKEIGTATVSFSDAAGGTADQVIPIDWDLTDTTDTNGGVWPAPVSTYNHFCVLVRVDLAGDVNLSNNVAQNNFFDVMGSSPGSSPLSFMVGGSDRHQDHVSFAKIVVSKLPEGFRAVVKVDGVESPTKGFRLKPGELRNAKVAFTRPLAYKTRRRVVANVSLFLDGKLTGGISLQLAGPRSTPAHDVIGKATSAYWNVKPEDHTERIKSEPGPQPQPPPKRTIPEPIKYRRTYKASYEKVFEAILRALEARKSGAEFADRDRGLINTRFVKLTRGQIVELVDPADAKRVKSGGFYWMSLWLQPRGDDETEVGVDAWIGVDDAYSPMGERFRSNGRIEKSMLASIGRALGE